MSFQNRLNKVMYLAFCFTLNRRFIIHKHNNVQFNLSILYKGFKVVFWFVFVCCCFKRNPFLTCLTLEMSTSALDVA